jgi:hypothetical protein
MPKRRIPPINRRQMLGAGAAAIAVLSTTEDTPAAVQQRQEGKPLPSPSTREDRRWLIVAPTDSVSQRGASPKLALCALDYQTLTRVVATDSEVLLSFETSRAFITVRLKCIDGRAEALSLAVLRGDTLDLRDTDRLGIRTAKISDYLEWERLLPPLPPRRQTAR